MFPSKFMDPFKFTGLWKGLCNLSDSFAELCYENLFSSSRWIFKSSKNNEFFLFPIFTDFIFHIYIYIFFTETSRTAFKCSRADSHLSFVPDLEEKLDSILNTVFHVSFRYTGILCYTILLVAWVQIFTVDRARWSQLIGYMFFMHFGVRAKIVRTLETENLFEII